MAIAVLFYLPTDWVQPYVLPLTFVGIALILGYAFYALKHRGLLVLVTVLVLGLMSCPSQAEIKDCGGSYKGGQGLGSAIQDGFIGGNILTSDFEDKEVLKCVQQNIVSLSSSICGAPLKEDSYETEVRNHAFYVVENVFRMSATEVSGGWTSWFTEKLGFTQSDLRKSYECAQKYIDNAAKVDKALEASCRTVGQTVQKGAEDCWPCSLVGMFIQSVQTMAGNMYPFVKTMALSLLGIVFLFWIAFRVLKFIGTMGYGDPGEFMTDLLIRFIVVSIAAALLHAPIIDFYRIAISPFINMTAALSGSLSEMAITDGHTTFAEQVQQKMGIKVADSCKACTLMNDPEYEFPKNEETSVVVMDAQSVNGLLCMTCQAYRQVMPMIAIGERMNCYAMVTGFTIPFTPITIPNFSYWYVGLILVIAFSILAVLVAFYILDVILRLGFVIVLTPLYITAWAFPVSREYSTKAWHMILSCLLQFIGIAVMMALFVNICLVMIPGDTTSLINYMVNDNVEGMYKVLTGMEPLPPAVGAVQSALVAGLGVGAAVGNPVALAAVGMATLLTLFLILAFVFFAFKMLTSTEKVVESLSGIAMGIPSISMGALTAIAKEGMQLAGMTGGASDKVKKMGEKIKDKMGAKMLNDKDQGGKSSSKGTFGGADKAANAAGKAAGNAVEKAGTAAGKGVTTAGQATTKAGGSMMAKGGALSATGLGAIVGVPLMVAGAATAAVGAGMQAAGYAMQASAKAAGASIKAGAKAASSSIKTSAKVAEASVKYGSKAAKKTSKTVKDVSKASVKYGKRAAKSATDRVKQKVDKEMNNEK